MYNNVRQHGMQTARKHATGNVIHYLICRNCPDLLLRAPSCTNIKNCAEIAQFTNSLQQERSVTCVFSERDFLLQFPQNTHSML